MKKWLFVFTITTSLIGITVFTFKPQATSIPKKFPLFKTTSLSIGNNDTTILLTGDIMLGRSVMATSLSKNNPNYPFEKVAGTLQRADVVFGNLENPIVANCPRSDSGFKFCADPKMVAGLSFAGVDVVSIANNHSANYGQEGIAQTKKHLKDAGIDYVGADNLAIKGINGKKLGFLGFDYVDYQPKPSDYELIKNSKRNVDILFVMVHWGVEYKSHPNAQQKQIAKEFVNAGADVVVGAHPHWVQDIDTVGGKPVFYSLGNFVFDQAWSEETKKGLAIRLTYKNGSLANIEKLPIYMASFIQPEWTKP
ncbi:MAG: hypothetical protein A2782_01000 [Candidatus Blackburnbacteria bacterium RIFCSPHIGHO2_01_FULL_43_15b]|uniref:Capsule synthesis protein CapA domain-containing protein n=1 Tax=Candidatus Blackburnbacteria bacterium RIFCSPHIGHO2_01_FULL_43_15b TaxID=1797513 RepID=A0A1G1V0X2_9BACT|nr:MAG: hypothetical protein A2782_01000 [Candidatus Blackburnbacteria bacterium RIFCSPHIGHO2_01_FULL_43_15b]